MDEEKAIKEEIEKGDFKKENLERAACYAVKCWAVYPRNSEEYLAKYVSDGEIIGLSNELAWIEARQSKGLFMISTWDSVKDFMGTDGLPLGKYTSQVVGGGISVYGGASLCAGTVGLGCAIGGGSMAILGAGNITEGATGFYTHFAGGEGVFNPVKTAFNNILGGYGPTLYSGADLATALGAGFVRVPLAMGVADGLNRSKSMFGVMVMKMDNNYYTPITFKPTPYGTAGAIYILGVGGKGYDLGEKIHGDLKNEN